MELLTGLTRSPNVIPQSPILGTKEPNFYTVKEGNYSEFVETTTVGLKLTSDMKFFFLHWVQLSKLQLVYDAHTDAC